MLLSVGVIHTFNFYEGNSLHEPGGAGRRARGGAAASIGRFTYRISAFLSRLTFDQDS